MTPKNGMISRDCGHVWLADGLGNCATTWSSLFCSNDINVCLRETKSLEFKMRLTISRKMSSVDLKGPKELIEIPTMELMADLLAAPGRIPLALLWGHQVCPQFCKPSRASPVQNFSVSWQVTRAQHALSGHHCHHMMMLLFKN